MNGLYDVWPREAENVIVAFDEHRVLFKALASEVFLGEFVALNHGAHRAVEHEYLLLGQLLNGHVHAVVPDVSGGSSFITWWRGNRVWTLGSPHLSPMDRGWNWHPPSAMFADTGCQDITGPFPSVFRDKARRM